MMELTTEEKLGQLIIELNELREKYSITYETLEEVVGILSVFSWEINVRPSLHRLSKEGVD